MASISEPFIRRPVGTTLLAIGLFLIAAAILEPLYEATGRDRELTELPLHALQDLRGNGMAMIFQEPMSSLNRCANCCSTKPKRAAASRFGLSKAWPTLDCQSATRPASSE